MGTEADLVAVFRPAHQRPPAKEAKQQGPGCENYCQRKPIWPARSMFGVREMRPPKHQPYGKPTVPIGAKS